MSDESVVNMALKFVDNYYCTYCEKCVSWNKKCIKDHNNNKPHQKFVKLQENTRLLKHFCIGDWLIIFMKFMFDYFFNPISNILIHFQNKVRENSHYMVCKACEASVPTYFESIMMHVIGLKHVQKQQI
jgi:hypothetical protein